MSNDLSRTTFNPLDDYFGVVMQQGRVQLDADWNTMVDQFKRRIQAGSLDTFSRSIVPRVTPDGFLIDGAPADITIGPGRIYVDGILAENHTSSLKWDQRLGEVSGAARLSGANIDAAPSGFSGTTSYSAQPYYPVPPNLEDAGENYLVYVDVWQRDINALQDQNLVDIAVGVDTTTRQQTVWQVKYLADVGNIGPSTSDTDIPGWVETIHPSSARLSTSTGDLQEDDNPCLLPPQTGYKGLENQLYRVQVHDGGPLGTATFKWSRDNAVVSSRINSLLPSGNQIVVDSLGRDDILSFNEGDWVEVIDDHRELMSLPGELRRISAGGIDRSNRTITLDGDPLPIGSGDTQFAVTGSNETHKERNTRLIRWDQAGIIFQEQPEGESLLYTDLNGGGSTGAIEIPPTGTKLFLEKGILVDFDLENVVDEATFEPEFKVGDYWVIAARVNSADIEKLDRAPPKGIHHHYTKLAIVNDSTISDCRTLWPPEANGEGCECTVCVEPETHNNGSATIQQAIEQVIAAGGGTVCLSIGEYQITESLRIIGNSITLRGQGFKTQLIAQQPVTIIEVGGDAFSSDITIENLSATTGTGTGFNQLIHAQNLFGFTLNDCLLINLASGNGTSQGIQLTGIIAAASIEDCKILAEEGITGPRLKDQYLATFNLTIQQCLISSSQRGINFSGFSFHSNKLNIIDNHIANTQDAGIELTGGSNEESAIAICNNLLVDCHTGLRTGISNTRILTNDFNGEGRSDGNAIECVNGFFPETEDHLQMIGNRIRNYSGHAISIQSAIGRIMVKQNQIDTISGSGFIIEAEGSIDYLSFENNQLSNIVGVLPNNNDFFAGIYIHALQQGDITNNILSNIVFSPQTSTLRAGISVANSADITIASNRIIGVAAINYGGTAVGIFVANSVGIFTVEKNKISRLSQQQETNSEPLDNAQWLPLAIMESFLEEPRSETRFFSGILPVSNINSQPRPFTLGDSAYALLATRLVYLGKNELDQHSAIINNNYLDGRFSFTRAVIIRLPRHCGLTNNTIVSNQKETEIVNLEGDHIAANNNRITTNDNTDTMVIDARRFVVMGNMTTGKIIVIEDGIKTSLPDPWSALNIII